MESCRANREQARVLRGQGRKCGREICPTNVGSALARDPARLPLSPSIRESGAIPFASVFCLLIHRDGDNTEAQMRPRQQGHRP